MTICPCPRRSRVGSASEVSRIAKVSLGRVRRCDAWEGRMWAIHPWTGGVNQQAIRHGANSLVMGGDPQGCGNMTHCTEATAFHSLINILSFGDTPHPNSHLPHNTHSALHIPVCDHPFSQSSRVGAACTTYTPGERMGFGIRRFDFLTFTGLCDSGQRLISLSLSILSSKVAITMIIPTQQDG